MTLIDVIVKSSIQIFQADEKNIKPEGFGTGFIAHYLGKYIFISVSHVTNNDNLTTFLETNLPPIENTTPLKPIGGFIFYDLLKVENAATAEEILASIENGGERIDITFAEIKDPSGLNQPFIDFGPFQVEEGPKIILNLDGVTIVPDRSRTYAFYGKVKPEYVGYELKMTPTLKNDLKFHRTSGDFHIFLSPSIITDKNDYKGCSGAPIIDDEGKLVGLACKIKVGSKMIFGFSIQKCMELIKLSINTNLL